MFSLSSFYNVVQKFESLNENHKCETEMKAIEQ